ncbi:hypothetical protein BDN72DRAFT_902074 [Pluteus cervinus]|uniref:Uncharacterized protein n=1 Tax=Pluteus cervinus TaxID=181527 RepID=A0ACD3AE82_9AGAR|nr:hypothetical protein BDN72DRAFT_902074 [Pluteus cervinus]
MRTTAKFFSTAIFFALVSSGQTRVVLSREVADAPDNGGIGDSSRTAVDCYQSLETCRAKEAMSVAATDAAGAAEGIPLLGGLLGGLLGPNGLLGGLLGPLLGDGPL